MHWMDLQTDHATDYIPDSSRKHRERESTDSIPGKESYTPDKHSIGILISSELMAVLDLLGVVHVTDNTMG